MLTNESPRCWILSANVVVSAVDIAGGILSRWKRKSGHSGSRSRDTALISVAALIRGWDSARSGKLVSSVVGSAEPSHSFESGSGDSSLGWQSPTGTDSSPRWWVRGPFSTPCFNRKRERQLGRFRLRERRLDRFRLQERRLDRFHLLLAVSR